MTLETGLIAARSPAGDAPEPDHNAFLESTALYGSMIRYLKQGV
jgi:hypothetical protein